MRKELIWVGIIGITFGLVIGFGVWRVRTSVINATTKPGPTATPKAQVGQFKISIDKPENFDVATANPETVSGITNSLTWVIVSGEKGDYLTQSLNDGSFSTSVDLIAGVNHIKATSLDSQGNTNSQKILVAYSASFQISTPTPDTSTSEADVSKAVALKLAQAGKPPKAYIGTVTDIADSTIQIKTTDSQIEQIATDKLDVTVVNTKGTTTKSVKLTDIAIGDFIVAMGYVDGNSVLDAQRILVADPSTEPELAVSIQKVSSVTKKTVSLTPVSGGQVTVITPDKNTNIESFSNGKLKSIPLSSISVSDYIIMVSDTTGTPALTRSLFDIGPQ